MPSNNTSRHQPLKPHFLVPFQAPSGFCSQMKTNEGWGSLGRGPIGTVPRDAGTIKDPRYGTRGPNTTSESIISVLKVMCKLLNFGGGDEKYPPSRAPLGNVGEKLSVSFFLSGANGRNRNCFHFTRT